MADVDIVPDQLTPGEIAAMTTANLEKEVSVGVTDGFDPVPRRDIISQEIARHPRGFTSVQFAITAGHIAVKGDTSQRIK